MYIYLLILIGLLSFLVGILFIIAPDGLYKINAYMNTKLFSDRALFSHRFLVAVVLIALGLLFIITAVQYL